MNVLSIKDVFYNMGDLEILEGISSDIEKGDCVFMVGQSGSGESALLKLCADMIPITSGNIYFSGKCYTRYNPIELREKINYCLQTPELSGKSVCENLEFPFKIRRGEVNKQRIVKLLERFNIDESFLGKDIISLSGGEKQRISIIRDLLYTPDIILLDEATSSLDLENAKIIEECVQELNGLGIAVLWITRSIEQGEKIFNKRITISEGKIKCMEVLR